MAPRSTGVPTAMSVAATATTMSNSMMEKPRRDRCDAIMSVTAMARLVPWFVSVFRGIPGGMPCGHRLRRDPEFDIGREICNHHVA
jgi:hypothetical protein